MEDFPYYEHPPPNLKLPFIGKICDFIKMPDLEPSLLLERGENIGESVLLFQTASAADIHMAYT